MNWYKESQQNQQVVHGEQPDFLTTQSEITCAEEFTDHLVLFRFNNGWTIQKVEKDVELENSFIPISSSIHDKQTEHIYSLRNEHNVPRANFFVETSKKDPSYFGISEVNYRYVPNQKISNEKYYQGLLKQFFDYLKSFGIKPKWIAETYTEKVDIRELKDFIVDPMGIPEMVWGKNSKGKSYQIGGGSDSYYEALMAAYGESCNGSYYSSSTARDLIDNIFSFAEAREEVEFLDNAVEMFEEKAFDWWCETDWGDMFPERPDEPTKEEFTREYKENLGQPEFKTKDFDKSKNTFFDEKAYNEAVEEYEKLNKEYEKKEAELQEDFEPYQFGNYAYKELQALKARLLLQKSQKNKK